MAFVPFRMERWQSSYEHRVRFNLSESGVHPVTVGELLELAGAGLDVASIRLGYGQSNGSDALRERVAALYPGATERCVVATAGGAEANFAATWYLAETARAAAVMLPNYMQVPGLVENAGATALAFHLREDNGWQPDLDELEEALHRGARFVLVTNPNNPTGAVLDGEAMAAVVAAAERVGAWILADEVYSGAELSGRPTPSFWGRYHRVIVTNSLSKAYGLPGLRLGWIVAPEPVAAELWARTDYTTIAPATVSDALAAVALNPPVRARILARTREILNRNLPILTGWLDERPDLFHYRPPDAGAICYLRYDAEVNSSELAERLRVEQDVLVVPGDHFGMDRYLRIGYGPPAAELEEALGRVGRTFASLSATAQPQRASG